MRISDWSSDVCSSDLIAQRALGGAECREPRLAAQAAAGACEEEAGTMAEGLVCVLPCEQCGQSGPCEIKAPQRVLAPMDLEFVPGLFEKRRGRSEEHTSELQSLMRISYAVFCLKKKNKTKTTTLRCKR